MSYCVLRFVSESKCGQLVGWVQKDIAHLRSQRSSRVKRGSRRHGRYQGSLDRAKFISCRIFGVDYSSCLHFAKEICSPGGWCHVVPREVCLCVVSDIFHERDYPPPVGRPAGESNVG